MNSKLAVLLVVLGVMAAACGGSPAPASPESGPETGSGGSVTAETRSAADDPTSTGSTMEPVMPIIHATVPGEPAYLADQMVFECTMGLAQAAPITLNRSCDSWTINYLERPFSPDGLQYYPFLDIELAQLGYSGGWFFVRMRIYEAAVPLDREAFTYAVELDPGFDGRGNALISVTDLPLNQTQWTVSGVQAWSDGNGDVGGTTSIRSDPSGGDGYETLLVDQGIGSDPDLVWARRSPENQRTIEFAFKPVLVDGGNAFLWWGWSFKGDFDPGLFDIVDSSTGLYQLDNTCSLEFNHPVLGLPNGCQAIQPTATPSPSCVKPDRPSSDPCWIWMQNQCSWICFN